MLGDILGGIQCFGPVALVTSVASVPLSGPAARLLGAPRLVAWILLMGLGGIVALTLTPGIPGAVGAVCDLSVNRPIPPRLLLAINERSMNVLLFVPVGLGIGLLPWSRRKLGLGVAALALPEQGRPRQPDRPRRRPGHRRDRPRRARPGPCVGRQPMSRDAVLGTFDAPRGRSYAALPSGRPDRSPHGPHSPA
jgi:hypothetical protein